MAPHIREDEINDCSEGSSSCLSLSEECNLPRHATIRYSASLESITTTLSRENYTAEEIEHCFYTHTEKTKLFRNHEKVMKRMESGKRPKKNSSYRGLENFLTDISINLENNIYECVDAIMDCQEDQWNRNVVNWEELAARSRAISEASTVLALRMAEYDRRQAVKAYKSMERYQENDEDSTCTEITNSTMTYEMKGRHGHSSKVSSKKRRASSSKKTKTISIIDDDSSLGASKKRSSLKKKKSSSKGSSKHSSATKSSISGTSRRLSTKLDTP